MGREQTERRKRLLFYFACALLAFLSFNGCLSVGNNYRKAPIYDQIHNHLERAKQMAKNGNCLQAIREQEKALLLSPDQPPGDLTLYEMGLLWIDPRNREPDYNKSLEIFKQLILIFPQSEYREEAATWTFVLIKFIESSDHMKEKEFKINILRDELQQKDKVIQILKEQQRKMKEIDLELNKKREPPSSGEK